MVVEGFGGGGRERGPVSDIYCSVGRLFTVDPLIRFKAP
jgi:hypothetical protein